MASWKENKKVGIGAGVLIVLAIVGVIYSMLPKKNLVTLKSESTGQVMKMKLKIGQEFPIVDPTTGEQDLYEALGYRCVNGHEFYVAIKDGEGAAAMLPRCPEDKSSEVTFIDEM